MIGRVGSARLLKNDAMGKNIISVLIFFPCPACISRPSLLKVSLMILHPTVMSSLVLKGKNLPSSRYSLCDTAVVRVEAGLLHLMLCPVSFLAVRELVSKFQWLNAIFINFGYCPFCILYLCKGGHDE